MDMVKSCNNCIHIAVCDKQKVTNHKISKSACKHFKDNSQYADRVKEDKVCEICEKKAKWEAILGAPYGYVMVGPPYGYLGATTLKVKGLCYKANNVKVAACPMCGRKMKGEFV